MNETLDTINHDISTGILFNKEGQMQAAKILVMQEESPLVTGMKLRALANIVEEALKLNKAKELEEAETYETEFSMMGVKMERSGRTNYLFNPDPIRDRLLEKVREMNEEVKNREIRMKTCKPGATDIDEETGEVFTVNPAKSSFTSFVKMSFPIKNKQMQP